MGRMMKIVERRVDSVDLTGTSEIDTCWPGIKSRSRDTLAMIPWVCNCLCLLRRRHSHQLTPSSCSAPVSCCALDFAVRIYFALDHSHSTLCHHPPLSSSTQYK